MIGMIFKLLGALGVFLYGMRVMSDGIQKVAGRRLQAILNYMTANRGFAVVTGFLITALVQSSSATTVMVVSFVNASLLSLTQAIGVIMGANIGTTVTTWIVSAIGFKFKLTAVALPIVGVGLPFMFSKIKKRRDFGEVLIGFGLLFLGLMFLKESVPDIKSNPEVLSFLQNYTNLGFMSILIFVGVGAILTVIVQSSSAAMAITVTMAYMGWINFPTAAAIVLGENIGTTVTAYLASIGTNVNARRTARAHLLFNILGVVWMTLLFQLFVKENGIIYKLAPWDPTQLDAHGKMVNLPLNLALFHTVFNILNTLVFIAFIPQFAKIVKKLIPAKDSDSDGKYELKYISTGLQDTGAMNLVKAKNEINKMTEIVENMFTTFLKVFQNPDKKMGTKVEQVKKWEELTDDMQEEITKYLVECSNDSLSERSMTNINAMMRIINELENIGDSCYKLMFLTQRKYDKKIQLHEKAQTEFNDFAEIVSESMSLYQESMNEQLEQRVLNHAYKLENKINHLRDNLKKAAQKRLQQGADVQAELLYLDLLKHFEHIGDNSVNIAEALRQVF